MSDGKTSDQMVDVLLGEIQGKTVSTSDEYFEGLVRSRMDVAYSLFVVEQTVFTMLR